MELYHFSVVLVGEASLGGDVDDHGALFVRGERAKHDINTVDRLRANLKKAARTASNCLCARLRDGFHNKSSHNSRILLIIVVFTATIR